MVLKYVAGATLLVLFLLIMAYMYINKIVVGSNTGSLPDGYTLVEANGHAFSTKISGDDQDIPVILLHVFPESSIMWNRLMSDLNKTGYYTVAPDQRGYSFKARPEEIAEYQISHLDNSTSRL